MSTLLYILTCLIIPILWGIAVNWIFDRFETRKKSPPPQDYQI